MLSKHPKTMRSVNIICIHEYVDTKDLIKAINENDKDFLGNISDMDIKVIDPKQVGTMARCVEKGSSVSIVSEKRNDYYECLNNHVIEVYNDYPDILIIIDAGIEVRKILNNNKLEYTLIYPSKSALDLWVGKKYREGASIDYIDNMIENWDYEIDEVLKDKSAYLSKKIEMYDMSNYIPTFKPIEDVLSDEFIDNRWS